MHPPLQKKRTTKQKNNWKLTVTVHRGIKILKLKWGFPVFVKCQWSFFPFGKKKKQFFSFTLMEAVGQRQLKNSCTVVLAI